MNDFDNAINSADMMEFWQIDLSRITFPAKNIRQELYSGNHIPVIPFILPQAQKCIKYRLVYSENGTYRLQLERS